METLLQEIHSHLSHLDVFILHNTAMKASRKLQGYNSFPTAPDAAKESKPGF